MLIQEIPPPAAIALYVDASTSWGIGIVLNGEWDHWRLKEGWRCKTRDIGWAEMVAVEFGLRAAVESGAQNLHLIMRSDNQGVVGALDGGKSRNLEANPASRVQTSCTHTSYMAHRLRAETWERTLAVHDTALAQGTTDSYRRAIGAFQQWAAAERVEPGNLPIAEPLLCAFAASFAGYKSGGCARSMIAGLRYHHERLGLTWLGSARLKRILDAVGKLAPDSASRKPRPPVTLAMIDEALKRLDPNRGFDQCVGAAMLVAFWGQARLGEILSATRTYDFARMPVRKHAKLRADAGGEERQKTSAIWLPRTKTAPRGEWLWLSRHHNDPSFALEEHFTDNRVGRDDPLFSYRDDHGVLIPLTKHAFLSRLNEIWVAAGMQTMTGHCFRIGGTTALLRLGVDTEIVKMSGRWKSDSFLRYWRNVENIIAAHTDLCDIAWFGDD